MTGYMSSNAPVPVSLLLKKCNYGTIFQVSFIILCYLFLGVYFDFATLIEIISAFLLSYVIFCPLWGEIFYIFIMIASSCFNAIDIKLLQNFRFSQLCHTSI